MPGSDFSVSDVKMFVGKEFTHLLLFTLCLRGEIVLNQYFINTNIVASKKKKKEASWC